MTEDRQRELFERYVPTGAVDYCFELWQRFGFDLRITQKRASKFGDYRYDPRTETHSISVNHDQSVYAFLITYIHEVAHKATFDLHQNRVKPHGKEWKHQFQKLMLPMLREDIFPMDILSPLALHMKSPKATSVTDAALYEALRKHETQDSNLSLRQIDLGQKFLFRKKIYRKLEVRRTRSLCELLDNGKQYLISESAPVQGFKN